MNTVIVQESIRENRQNRKILNLNIIKTHTVFNHQYVIFGFVESKLKVLLCKQTRNNNQHEWLLPQGCVHSDECIDDASKRIVHDFTGKKKVYIAQLKTVEHQSQHVFERNIQISFLVLVKATKNELPIGECYAQWISVCELPQLEVQTNQILLDALNKLRILVNHEYIGFELLLEKFTLRELQDLYEEIFNWKFDKPNFRKKINSLNLIIKLDEKEPKTKHRAANLYKLKKPLKKAKIYTCNFEI